MILKVFNRQNRGEIFFRKCGKQENFVIFEHYFRHFFEIKLFKLVTSRARHFPGRHLMLINTGILASGPTLEIGKNKNKNKNL